MPGFSLHNGLAEVRAGQWPWKIEGTYKDRRTGEDKERPAHKIIDIASYDPAPIRGIKPPPRDSTTRIPIAIAEPGGYYSWCDVVFNDLLKINGLVKPEDLRLFAIMLEHHAQHLVIDLDGDADAWPQLLGKEVEIEAELRALFAEFYQTEAVASGASGGFGAAPDMAAWRADRVPAPASKTSIHINHPSVAFKTQLDLREFVLRFVRWIVTTHADSILVSKDADASRLVSVDDFARATPIDVRVYNADRNMRLSHSRKPGKQPLVPMDPNTTLEDALWSSLVCYSMPADPSLWLSYTAHPECVALDPNSSKGRSSRPAAKRKAAAVPLPSSPLIVASAEPSVPAFKGTVAQMPPKELCGVVGDLPEKDASAQLPAQSGVKDSAADCAMADKFAVAMREEWDATSFFKYMPHPKPDDVKLILNSLSQKDRLLGIHDKWRDCVWAVKAACPSDAGYAIVEEWTKGGKPGSKRPGVLMKTWLSGRTDRFSIANLWKWAKEDLTGDAYRALWRRVNPPEVMEAARKAAADLNEGAVARVVESWNQMFGKTNEQKEHVFATREVTEYDGKVTVLRELVCEARNELPTRAVMNWFAGISEQLIERITEAGLMKQLMERTVLPMCNMYWKMLREKKQDRIFVKQGCDQPDDDRKFRWLEMTEKRFTGAAHTCFKLNGVHGAKGNMAQVWLDWVARETYNGPACVPDTARKEHQPAPFQFNEWVGLRVSHARARRDGDPQHQDWVDFKNYLWNAFLQGEPDKRVKEYFVKWYISQYVRPGFKLKVAIVMYSELNQRGKTELPKMLRTLLLGDTVGVECQSEDALDKFNELIAGKLVVALEEYKRSKAYNDRFKVEITAATHNINGKNDKVYTEPNCANWMVSTNDTDAVDVDAFSKRVCVVHVLDGIETVLTQEDGTTFDYVQWKERQWSAVHLAAGMLQWAEELDLDHWDPTDIPVTEGEKLQRRAGEAAHDPVAAWWRQFVTNKARADEVTWGAWNSAPALFKIFQTDNADDRKLMLESKNWFTEQFSRRGFAKGNRFITAAMRARAILPAMQQNVQAFLLPTREFALQTLDKKMRAGRTDDE